MKTELFSPNTAREVLLRRRGGWLAISESVVSAGAIAGAVGLIQGSVNLGGTIKSRLPFESLVFAGVALFVIVTIPMAGAAIAAWRGATNQIDLAMGAGALLMGWIVIELAVIRSFSWLQPTFLLAGAAIFVAGYRQWHSTSNATDDETAFEVLENEIDVPENADDREAEPAFGSVDLYWSPLGAGAHIVRLSGKLLELLSAPVQHRRRRDLYHSALIVRVPEGRCIVEQAPIPDLYPERRGVVADGPVEVQWIGRYRVFRYEVRCWRGGVIPDIDSAVTSPVRLVDDLTVAQRILDRLPTIPTPAWGRVSGNRGSPIHPAGDRSRRDRRVRGRI